MVEDRKVRDRRDFIIPLCVFGWKEGKMKEYKTNQKNKMIKKN